MKLPSYRRIFKTDYAEDYQELVEKLAVSINNGFDSLYDALNKKLTFGENISSTIAEITVTVEPSGAPIKKGTQFKLDGSQNNIQGLIVINCYEEKTGASPPGAPFISFIKNENNILINKISGLTPNVSYIIKVLTIT
jgi:hypothetical protein